MPINADVNDLAKHMRKTVANEETELDRYLAAGRLYFFIFKHIVEKAGWVYSEIEGTANLNKGREIKLTKKEQTLIVNLEFSSSNLFKIKSNKEGSPTQNKVDYYVLMDLKFIAFVKPEDIQIENPKVKDEQYYELDIRKTKVKAKHLIQYTDLVI